MGSDWMTLPLSAFRHDQGIAAKQIGCGMKIRVPSKAKTDIDHPKLER
jgi:hypothetical protein